MPLSLLTFLIQRPLYWYSFVAFHNELFRPTADAKASQAVWSETLRYAKVEFPDLCPRYVCNSLIFIPPSSPIIAHVCFKIWGWHLKDSIPAATPSFRR